MILSFKGKNPQIDPSVYIAHGAIIIGDVVIGKGSSVWFNTVIRGDVNYIQIGNRTNIQDGCVLHVARDKYPLIIGHEVTVGHNATLHACNIASHCLIGMGSVIMDGSKISDNCIVGAGSLLTPQTIIPSCSLVIGSPAKVKRKLTDEEIQTIHDSSRHYMNDIQSYLSQ